jgi:Electron transfer DM13
MQWIRDHLKIVIPAAVVVVGLVAYLAFGVFGVQFLFLDDEVDEAAPVFASGAGTDDDSAATDETTIPVATTAQPATTVPPPPTVSDGAAATGAPATTAAPTTAGPTAAPTTAAPPTTVPPSTQPQIVTLVEGSFVSRDHPGQGIAKVLTDGSSQRFLRFEEFSTDNGPDLNVYLTTADANAPEGDFDDEGEYVDLGNLKGNIGDQNYEIPPDVDLDRFDTVVVWCVRFSSAFTAADLLPV